MKRNRFRIIVLSVIFGAFIGAILTQIAIARADTNPVCGWLDTHPGPAGVEDVVGIAIVQVGLTPQQAADTVFSIIYNECPRHLLSLREYVNKWAPQSVPAAPISPPAVNRIPRGEQVA